jgi:hypothetical protein
MVGRSPSERRPAFQTAPLAEVEGVAYPCRCAGETPAAQFGCLDCGAACCSVCAIPLESVAYCRRCATALLGATATLKSGSFELY